MFKFIKQIFVSTLMFFGSLSSVNPLECVSMNNQECKVRPENVKEEKITDITLTENINKHKYSSCTLYIVLFSIIFTINIGLVLILLILTII